MTIYEAKYYGVYYCFKQEYSGVNIYPKKELLHAVPGFDNFFFEITLLKEYNGKEDVLKIQFENGDIRYETLTYPFMCMDIEDDVWRKSKNKSTPEAFMQAYYKSL